jgi:FAD binding domain
MNDIPEEDLRTLEERFGDRFVRHAAAEADAGESFATVFPESAEEVESLTRLAARHEIPLMARGAGNALHQGKAPRALVVRFDGMQRIRLPEEAEEDWVEVEPGATWVAQEDRLRDRGMGPRVYPTSAPRSTVGGWLAENGLGVGSYEYGWLLANVRSVEAVMAGGSCGSFCSKPRANPVAMLPLRSPAQLEQPSGEEDVPRSLSFRRFRRDRPPRELGPVRPVYRHEYLSREYVRLYLLAANSIIGTEATSAPRISCAIRTNRVVTLDYRIAAGVKGK